MTSFWNLASACLAFALGGLALIVSSPPGARENRSAVQSARAHDLIRTLPSGARVVRDESGTEVPISDFSRIASGSTISDALLLEFVSPDRIVAFTQYSQENRLFGHRYQHKPRIDALRDMERLLALRPDLLVISTLSAETRLGRLRDAGLNVFVLGEMRGLESFLRNVRSLSALLDRPELGELYAQSFERRMRSIAATLPASEQKTALQLTYYAGRIYGSGRGTSYHDVLRFAGLRDLGAEHYEGWPALSVERVLALDPEIIVTRDSMGAALCSEPTLSRMKACALDRRGVVELPDALINDPGAAMLPSAELIYQSVYGDPR